MAEAKLLRLDLKAFERRLTEIVGFLQPSASRWRIILVIAFFCTVTAAIQWIVDPLTVQVGLLTSLLTHWFFALSFVVLMLLFLSGIHRRVVKPSIVAARGRKVLSDFHMSCDDNGKLILKPRPASP